MFNVFFFFFSSRRRHTRLTCDWSSDVCSSDLTPFHHGIEAGAGPQSLCVSCNACETVCPVEIPLPNLILDVRSRTVEAKGLNPIKKVVFGLMAHPRLFDIF